MCDIFCGFQAKQLAMSDEGMCYGEDTQTAAPKETDIEVRLSIGALMNGNNQRLSAVSPKQNVINDIKEGLFATSAAFGEAARKFKDTVAEKANYSATASSKKPVYAAVETREAYPRMPWHDLQACVAGSAARDVAAHFIQVGTVVNNSVKKLISIRIDC
jgi:hypothetical protein